MDVKEMVFNVRQRIAELEGQVAGANAELVRLKELPCPNCNGRGSFSSEETGVEGSTWIKIDNCEVCSGSGKAAGKTRY
jgi:DnaJ-class molecular chaperone